MKTLIRNSYLILLLTTANLIPQQKDSLVLLSNTIGETVDENESYKIRTLNLESYRRFNNAAFYIRNDSLLAVKINFTKSKNELVDTTIIFKAFRLNNFRSEVYDVEIKEPRLLDDGTIVVVTTKDSSIYEGVIGFVNSDKIILLKRKSNIESLPDYDTIASRSFQKQDIQSVFIAGQSNVLLGTGLGCLLGSITGYIAGASEGDDPKGSCQEGNCLAMSAEQKGSLSGAVLGVVGAAAGLIIGLVTTTLEEEIFINEDYNLKELSEYAIF
jgi:hypothetical protein